MSWYCYRHIPVHVVSEPTQLVSQVLVLKALWAPVMCGQHVGRRVACCWPNEISVNHCWPAGRKQVMKLNNYYLSWCMSCVLIVRRLRENLASISSPQEHVSQPSPPPPPPPASKRRKFRGERCAVHFLHRATPRPTRTTWDQNGDTDAPQSNVEEWARQVEGSSETGDWLTCQNVCLDEVSLTTLTLHNSGLTSNKY